MEHLFLMFLDHTQRRSTFGRTPLDELSARRRDLYLTTHDTHAHTHICVYLKIYNKFANYFCELKFSGNTHQRP